MKPTFKCWTWHPKPNLCVLWFWTIQTSPWLMASWPTGLVCCLHDILVSLRTATMTTEPGQSQYVEEILKQYLFSNMLCMYLLTEVICFNYVSFHTHSLRPLVYRLLPIVCIINTSRQWSDMSWMSIHSASTSFVFDLFCAYFNEFWRICPGYAVNLHSFWENPLIWHINILSTIKYLCQMTTSW